jgi:Phage derived protein Gp49-like (DUF891)
MLMSRFLRPRSNPAAAGVAAFDFLSYIILDVIGDRTMWSVEPLNVAVEREINALPEDLRARLERIVQLIEGKGLPNVREPYVKHLDGKLWEMRMTGRDNIARTIYVQQPDSGS